MEHGPADEQIKLSKTIVPDEINLTTLAKVPRMGNSSHGLWNSSSCTLGHRRINVFGTPREYLF